MIDPPPMALTYVERRGDAIESVQGGLLLPILSNAVPFSLDLYFLACNSSGPVPCSVEGSISFSMFVSDVSICVSRKSSYVRVSAREIPLPLFTYMTRDRKSWHHL